MTGGWRFEVWISQSWRTQLRPREIGSPAEGLLSLGSAHFRNGDFEAAEMEWKAAIEVNPKLGEAHNNLAVIYMTSGRFKEAKAEVKAAEKTGFRVNPQFKEDLKKAASGR